MKIIILTAIIVFTGCVGTNRRNIPGIYTRESAGEYSRAWDTLIIEDYNQTSGTYRIQRKTGFIRIKEGLPQPKEWHTEKMITDYDEATEQLTDRKTGRLFSFKEGEVLFGTAAYKKEARSK
jgi:hypothetical protein